MRESRRAGGATVVAALVGLCVLAGCSSSHGDAVGHPTTTTSASNSRTTSTTAASSTTTASAVLAGYRASWSAFENALSDADPSDPALAATMVAPQLEGVKANLLADQRQGIVGRGPTTLHPKVTAVSGTTATVVDCAYSATELVYKATGKQVPPVTQPENDGVTATLVLSGGVWKVSKQTVTDGSCASGS
jgi:hypothetical protein